MALPCALREKGSKRSCSGISEAKRLLDEDTAQGMSEVAGALREIKSNVIEALEIQSETVIELVTGVKAHLSKAMRLFDEQLQSRGSRDEDMLALLQEIGAQMRSKDSQPELPQRQERTLARPETQREKPETQREKRTLVDLDSGDVVRSQRDETAMLQELTSTRQELTSARQELERSKVTERSLTLENAKLMDRISALELELDLAGKAHGASLAGEAHGASLAGEDEGRSSVLHNTFADLPGPPLPTPDPKPSRSSVYEDTRMVESDEPLADEQQTGVQRRDYEVCRGASMPYEVCRSGSVPLLKGSDFNRMSFKTQECLEAVFNGGEARHEGTQLFDAVKNGDMAGVETLVEEHGKDPNVMLERYEIRNGRTFLPCSVLAAAVLCGNLQMVELLLEKKADPASKYGMVAGSSRRLWVGPCSNAAVGIDRLDILKCLLKHRADAHAYSSNNASLVWQCAYLGRYDILCYLLELGVSIEDSAEHQDMENVSHTPVHVATIRGNQKVVEKLLQHRAHVDIANEQGRTPLDDAIAYCRPQLLTLLMRHFCRIREHQHRGRESNDSVVIEVEQFREFLDRAFESNNPIIIDATAAGLHGSEHVSNLTIDQLVTFLKTPGSSPETILNAVFLERKVSYWEDSDNSLQRRDISTALIPRPHVLPNGEHIAMMNVVSTHMTGHDLQAQLAKKLPLDGIELQGLRKLAPQSFHEKSDPHNHAMCSVSLYEGMVCGLHIDLRVLKAITELEYSQFTNKPVQAVIEYCWQESAFLNTIQVIVNVVLLVVYFVIGFALDDAEMLKIVRWSSALGLVCIMYHLSNEVLQIIGFTQQGWLGEYLQDPSNGSDILRCTFDFILLFYLLIQGQRIADVFMFRVCFSLSVFSKWVQVLNSITPFRRTGPALLPIIHAMYDTGAFYTVLLFHIMGLWNAYASLRPELDDRFNLFARVAELSLMQEVFSTELLQLKGVEMGPRVTTVFYLCAALYVGTTLMNVFIAALGNSFNHATDNMESIFNRHRALIVLTNVARRDGIKKMFSIKARPAESLWYCCGAGR